MALEKDAILKIFKETGALLEGHFILTSGLHSGTYFQCARVFQHPHHAESLAREIADHFKGENIDVVVSPAVGGIVFGQEVARLLPARAIFTERVEGRMVLRRGFELSAGERVLVAEDVTTTGGSVSEVIGVAREAGAVVVAVTAVVDRSSGRALFDVPYFSLIQMDIVNYDPSDCPLCRAGSVAVKPGSRSLKS
ncbi:MAG: orotate phosphoribosyltransferase [Candidatus Aminicenantes bacterium]|nr:orotate phosphoribosyltransferase [Candidatus Aminicenantes bacterium]